MSLRRKKVRKVREGVMTLILSGKNLWLEMEQVLEGARRGRRGDKDFHKSKEEVGET